MTNRHIEQLVEDTLYYRRGKRLGCFAFNTARKRLVNKGEIALPAIMTRIIQLCSETQSPPDGSKYMGISHLYMAYLELAAQWTPHSIVPFLRSLPILMASEVLARSHNCFRLKEDLCHTTRDRYTERTFAPQQLMTFAAELEQHPCIDVRNNALIALECAPNDER